MADPTTDTPPDTDEEAYDAPPDVDSATSQADAFYQSMTRRLEAHASFVDMHSIGLDRRMPGESYQVEDLENDDLRYWREQAIKESYKAIARISRKCDPCDMAGRLISIANPPENPSE